MNSFIQYVLWELKNSALLVALVGLLALAMLLSAWLIHRKRYGREVPFPWGKALCWLALAGYLAVVIYATVLRHSGGFRQWNLHLFRGWREAWNQFSVKLWSNVLLNVALFIPMGFLPQLLSKWPRKWYFGIGLGFTASLFIELLQLAASRGVCDVDDLFANTLGTAIGFLAVTTLLLITDSKGKHRKKAYLSGALMLVPCLAIGSIFVTYNLKEYGNLPGAASYTNNTRSVTWNAVCEIPEERNTVAVYRTQRMEKSACDAFAEEIASRFGQEVLMGSYFEEMAYYNLSRGILSVSYYDGSYELYLPTKEEKQWTELQREAVEEVLAGYAITVPGEAEFASEGDGWYCFACQGYDNGGNFAEGALRVRCSADGEIERIENGLVWYTYYKDETVISLQEAWALLCAGKFGDDGFFEYTKPEEVTVVSWVLDYQIDTKGFYRPVYRFTVESPDGAYRDTIMIPAIQ